MTQPLSGLFAPTHNKTPAFSFTADATNLRGTLIVHRPENLVHFEDATCSYYEMAKRRGKAYLKPTERSVLLFNNGALFVAETTAQKFMTALQANQPLPLPAMAVPGRHERWLLNWALSSVEEKSGQPAFREAYTSSAAAPAYEEPVESENELHPGLLRIKDPRRILSLTDISANTSERGRSLATGLMFDDGMTAKLDVPAAVLWREICAGENTMEHAYRKYPHEFHRTFAFLEMFNRYQTQNTAPDMPTREVARFSF